MKPSLIEQVLSRALAEARETRLVRMAPGARRETGAAFAKLFGSSEAFLVADSNTFAAAGRDALDSLRAAGQKCAEPFIFTEPDLYAEYGYCQRLRDALARTDAIAVAVGSGTINDLTKRASHELGRPYMSVATAASMDGYTAYGASITRDGQKLTLECPAPAAVVADLDVITGAPEALGASGYADLLAKIAAGADWIVAATAGAEPIAVHIWEMVQGPLRMMVANPEAIRRRDPDALHRLICGLLITGFAMQSFRSSRPASGCEHQFSHLWDMQHHTYRGVMPSHGFKVGIGTLASAALHDWLFSHAAPPFEVEAAAAAWPELADYEAEAARLFEGQADVTEKALEEIRAKQIPREAIHNQLTRLHADWAEMRVQIKAQLQPFDELAAMLATAGAPSQPEQIGITRPHLRRAYREAFFVRRRFTVLDLAERIGLFEPALAALFSADGPWSSSLEMPAAEGVTP